MAGFVHSLNLMNVEDEEYKPLWFDFLIIHSGDLYEAV